MTKPHETTLSEQEAAQVFKKDKQTDNPIKDLLK